MKIKWDFKNVDKVDKKPSKTELHRIANVCTTVIYISSQNKTFLATPNVENKCWTSYETLESTGEKKLIMKFTCTVFAQFRFPLEMVLGVIYIFSFNNFKKHCKIQTHESRSGLNFFQVSISQLQFHK